MSRSVWVNDALELFNHRLCKRGSNETTCIVGFLPTGVTVEISWCSVWVGTREVARASMLVGCVKDAAIMIKRVSAVDSHKETGFIWPFADNCSDWLWNGRLFSGGGCDWLNSGVPTAYRLSILVGLFQSHVVTESSDQLKKRFQHSFFNLITGFIKSQKNVNKNLVDPSKRLLGARPFPWMLRLTSVFCSLVVLIGQSDSWFLGDTRQIHFCFWLLVRWLFFSSDVD